MEKLDNQIEQKERELQQLKSYRQTAKIEEIATIDQNIISAELQIKRLWDNKKVWQALESKGFQIMSGLDVIEYTLKAGEKDRIIDAIDTLSGYESNIEEVAKN